MKAIILVIDSFGIGEMPDAESYGDAGSNTAFHVCEAVPGAKWANLQRLGLGNASSILGRLLPGCGPVDTPLASYGVMAERSPGKDTTTGHWELAGVVLKKPFTTFPPDYPSFPSELIAAFEDRIHRKVIGNRAASGTVIIQELGPEHLQTGRPIVYTSGDSVCQIAAHEKIIPENQLYDMCAVARELCDPYHVGRVIARPFEGGPTAFTRTEGRRDFSLPPPHATILDHLQNHGVETIGIGKIGDIFCEIGLTKSYHDKGNVACLERSVEVINENTDSHRLIFVNLVDSDMIYGHRRDARGYLEAVARIDSALPGILDALATGDVAVVTADHGCDPTFRGTDHTREHVPLLWYQKDRRVENLGVRSQFSDVAQSLATEFGASPMANGEAI